MPSVVRNGGGVWWWCGGAISTLWWCVSKDRGTRTQRWMHCKDAPGTAGCLTRQSNAAVSHPSNSQQEVSITRHHSVAQVLHNATVTRACGLFMSRPLHVAASSCRGLFMRPLHVMSLFVSRPLHAASSCRAHEHAASSCRAHGLAVLGPTQAGTALDTVYQYPARTYPHLGAAQVSDVGVAALGRLRSLRRLSLAFNTSLTDRGLAGLLNGGHLPAEDEEGMAWTGCLPLRSPSSSNPSSSSGSSACSSASGSFSGGPPGMPWWVGGVARVQAHSPPCADLEGAFAHLALQDGARQHQAQPQQLQPLQQGGVDAKPGLLERSAGGGACGIGAPGSAAGSHASSHQAAAAVGSPLTHLSLAGNYLITDTGMVCVMPAFALVHYSNPRSYDAWRIHPLTCIQMHAPK